MPPFVATSVETTLVNQQLSRLTPAKRPIPFIAHPVNPVAAAFIRDGVVLLLMTEDTVAAAFLPLADTFPVAAGFGYELISGSVATLNSEFISLPFQVTVTVARKAVVTRSDCPVTALVEQNTSC